MDYIAIRNKGLIVEEDLMLLGSSTKREDSTKIGMFGSGWKYALAWLLRNKCPVKVYSGRTPIEINTRHTTHRSKDVYIITINGRDTSLTTEMGPEWTGWMALREIISNAIDEGGYVFEPDSTLKPEDNTTTVYIGVNDELKGVTDNFDNYFAFNRKDAISLTKNARVFIKDKPSEMVIYRKGIRCFNSKVLTYVDFDFDIITVNEYRLTELNDIHISISGVIYFSTLITPDILIALLTSFENDSAYIPGGALEYNKTLFTMFSNYIKEKKILITSPSLTRLFGAINNISDGLTVPDEWYHYLVKEGVVENHFNILLGDNVPAGFVIKEPTFNINSVHEYLNRIGLYYTIYTGEFVNPYEACRIKGTGVYIKYNFSNSASTVASRIIQASRLDVIAGALEATRIKYLIKNN